jgi:hypothetical protein
MKITRFSLFLVASTSIFALLTASSCKKSNNNSSGSGMSATISGTAFNSAVSQGGFSQSANEWFVGGYSVKSNDTSILEVGIFHFFPSENPQFVVGKSFTTDTTSAYVDYFSNGFNGKDYDASNGNGFATFTVTSLDTTGHKIAGTFSGVLYASSSDSVIVTNGNFNSSYTLEP